MNGNTLGSERTRSDFVLFGLVFFGVVIAASGLVAPSLFLAVSGGLLAGVGLCGFLLKQFLGE
jgi:hypothetical protein